MSYHTIEDRTVQFGTQNLKDFGAKFGECVQL